MSFFRGWERFWVNSGAGKASPTRPPGESGQRRSMRARAAASCREMSSGQRPFRGYRNDIRLTPSSPLTRRDERKPGAKPVRKAEMTGHPHPRRRIRPVKAKERQIRGHGTAEPSSLEKCFCCDSLMGTQDFRMKLNPHSLGGRRRGPNSLISKEKKKNNDPRSPTEQRRYQPTDSWISIFIPSTPFPPKALCSTEVEGLAIFDRSRTVTTLRFIHKLLQAETKPTSPPADETGSVRGPSTARSPWLAPAPTRCCARRCPRPRPCRCARDRFH